MAKLSINAGSTSVMLYVWIGDSSSTTGGGLTGLVYNTASLVASYVLPGAARVAITLATQTVTGAYSSGGFVEVDATNMPGLYRLDVPDAALASGRSSVVMLKGAANMAPCVLEIDLTTDANVVRLLGTGWLPPAVAGTPDVNAKQLGGVPVTATTSVTIPAASTLATTTGAVGSVTAGVTLAASAVQAIWDAATSALTTVGSIGKKLADWTIHSAADVWASVTRTLTAATNITSTGGTTVPQTGDSFARLGAPAGASVSADVAAVKVDTAATLVDTAEIGTAGAGLTALATAASLAAVAADLPSRITKNTALAGFVFPMYDSTDHVTPKTGLTITAQRSLDGAALASCANAASEISNGLYKIDLAAADLNGNTVTLRFTSTGADATIITLATQPT